MSPFDLDSKKLDRALTAIGKMMDLAPPESAAAIATFAMLQITNRFGIEALELLFNEVKKEGVPSTEDLEH
jgi:hypothetical protein